MASLTNLFLSALHNTKQTLINPSTVNVACVRNAAKKARGSTKNPKGHPRPKHRGWKVQDGEFVQAGTILVTQLTLRFHPGLNVGFGRNGTLFAMEPGRVVVTCEKIEPNYRIGWVSRNYEGREGQTIYKKHFNVIPGPESKTFNLVDAV